MIEKLIVKYKNKIKDTQQDMYKNEIPLDFTEGFDENINPGEYTCYPIELWEEIMQDLEELQSQLDIASKKLDKIKNHVQTQQSIIKRQPSADRSIDDCILARLDTILSIIGGE